MGARKDRGAPGAPRSRGRRATLFVALAFAGGASAAAAGTITVTDDLAGWNGGAPLVPAAGGTYVEEGSVTIAAAAETVTFSATAGDLTRSATANNPSAALAVRYEVRRSDGTWSSAFGQGLASTSWADPNVTGTITYVVRATITTTITSTTLRGAYAAGLVITLTPS